MHSFGNVAAHLSAERRREARLVEPPAWPMSSGIEAEAAAVATGADSVLESVLDSVLDNPRLWQPPTGFLGDAPKAGSSAELTISEHQGA